MEYRHLKALGPAYDRALLAGEDDAEVRGIEWVVENIIPNFAAQQKFELEPDESMLGRIVWEVTRDVLRDLVDYIEADTSMYVISMLESGRYPDIIESAEASLADGAEA